MIIHICCLSEILFFKKSKFDDVEKKLASFKVVKIF